MRYQATRSARFVFFGYVLAITIAVFTGLVRPAQGKEVPGDNPPPVSSPGLPPAAPRTTTAAPASTSSGNRDTFLRRTWGVDALEVRSTSSGELLRFSYRVLDAEKAKALNDKKFEPHLIDETTGYMLQVPVMEKVGQLRQTATPLDGRQYWMVFSNNGKFVRPGSRVDILIGRFRVNGLVVDEDRNAKGK